MFSNAVPSAFGSEALGFSQKFPGIEVRTSIVNAPFYYRIGREVALGCGCISADRKTVLHNLHQDRSVVLVIGGADEALLCGTKKMRLVLHNRKGFVKMALQTGSALVPCMAFGENNTFNQVFQKGVRETQISMMKQMGFSAPLVPPVVLPLWTNKGPMTTVVGKPIWVSP